MRLARQQRHVAVGRRALVCFSKGWFKFNGPNTHAIDRSRPGETALARSLDGGETWTPEPFVVSDAVPAAPVDFKNPGLALRVSGDAWQHSYDRGKTWSRPQKLPDFIGARLMCRTDYQILSASECVLFICGAKKNGDEGRVFSVRTADGGVTWSLMAYIGDEPEGYTIMPASAVLENGDIFVAVRCASPLRSVCWIDGYLSRDGGKSYGFVSTPVKYTGFNGNPPALVRMRDGRLCIVYGYRSRPAGLRCVYSADGGRTWKNDTLLRTDAGCWDIGYPRAVQRSDGKLVALYYYCDAADAERYIAATIFDPDSEETIAQSFERGFRMPVEWMI